MTKHATTDHPIHTLLAARFSPYAFSDRSVAAHDLCSLFEAARWAPSSYNEQPWSFVVATQDDAEAFETMLSCLVEANQEWARNAPVLAIGVLRERFVRNDKANAAAEHDLGLATANLIFEATARGLSAHAMIGIDPERARECYQLQEHSRALTGLAIGYAGDPSALPQTLAERDRSPRERKPLGEFVFGSRFGQPALFVP